MAAQVDRLHRHRCHLHFLRCPPFTPSIAAASTTAATEPSTIASPTPRSPHLTPPRLATPRFDSPHFTRLASTHLASPRLTSPRLASPRLPSPHPTTPRLASPHLTPFASPHLASPHLASPRLASPHLTSPRHTSSRLASPHLTSPRLTPPPLALPRSASPRLAAHHLPSPPSSMYHMYISYTFYNILITLHACTTYVSLILLITIYTPPRRTPLSNPIGGYPRGRRPHSHHGATTLRPTNTVEATPMGTQVTHTGPATRSASARPTTTTVRSERRTGGRINTRPRARSPARLSACFAANAPGR